MFARCTELTNITIPDSVISIGQEAFYRCTSLANITIPDSVISIGEHVFEGTAYVKDNGNWENNALYIDNHLIVVKSPIDENYTIRNGTISIASGGFADCASLTNITIPDSVISIGGYAFCGCTSLTNITISNGVTVIDDISLMKYFLPFDSN